MSKTETCTGYDGDEWTFYTEANGDWRWRRKTNGCVTGVPPKVIETKPIVLPMLEETEWIAHPSNPHFKAIEINDNASVAAGVSNSDLVVSTACTVMTNEQRG